MKRTSSPANPAQLQVTVGVTSRHVVVRVSGELDIATAEPLRTAVTELDLKGELPVVVNLSEVSFCDVAGHRGLLNINAWLSRRHPSVTFVGARPNVRRVIRAANVDTIFAVT